MRVLCCRSAGLRGSCARYLPPKNSIKFDTNVHIAEALHAATVDSKAKGRPMIIQDNRNGWVDPEDLAPMPQCIAQQNQSTWLSTMTKCTSKRCTRHFGVICTQHQWLTQLSCLSIEFSPGVIEGYFLYCARSVLAKAQLYQWTRNITGRTWLVDVGDANGLQNLSPASLAKGYAAVDVTFKAPTCLTSSGSVLSTESFQNVMASCSFTSNSQHTGNAARPWEYRESLRSMIALDSETVGYNLTGRLIPNGEYFDKECFCNAFTIDPKIEPCSGPESGQIDITKERLWLNVTCGSTSLPNNWTDILKTTEFAYIPIEDWHWPRCVADMSKQVIGLPDQCATDACEIDSSSYCKVKRAIDRVCFCRDISYGSCGGSCQIFETRIDYIKWLHDLCGNVHDWHGLPDNWRQLAAPTPLDIVPWRWTLNPSKVGSIGAKETCDSNERKLGSFALVNIAFILTLILSQKEGIPRVAHGFLWHRHPWCWIFKGTLIAAFQLLANFFNALLIQNTPGYEDVPVYQLMLLWCSVPRLAWLPILLICIQPYDGMNISAAASSLFAEIILQFFSSYYMVLTVNYGWKHDFYLGGMKEAEREGLAKIMYAGALMWFVMIGPALAQLTRATHIMDKSRGSEVTPLMSSEEGDHAVYGTFSVIIRKNWLAQNAFKDLYPTTVTSMLLLWIAQWVFWVGFIGLSSEEYVLKQIPSLY